MVITYGIQCIKQVYGDVFRLGCHLRRYLGAQNWRDGWMAYRGDIQVLPTQTRLYKYGN